MTLLRTYWVTFGDLGKPTPLNLGCGVTAYDREDALELVRNLIFSGKGLPEATDISDDVSIDDLEQNHVAPNIGNIEARGIWFPQGYSPTRL